MRDKILPVPMLRGALGNSATAARLPLEQVVMVRIHVPQPNQQNGPIVQWSRTPGSQPGNRGSNPLGSTSYRFSENYTG